MAKMGWKRSTNVPEPVNRILSIRSNPYLLRKMQIERPNNV